jgi:hypothetical protein
MLVKDACKSRGQDPNIGSELEIMLSKYSNVKVVESDYRTCDMSKLKVVVRDYSI